MSDVNEKSLGKTGNETGMKKMNISQLSQELQDGFRELSSVLKVEADPEGLCLRAVQTPDKEEISISYDETGCMVTYQKRPQFFKALAHVLRGDRADVVLTPAFKDLESMVDCSRNAVLSVDGAKSLIRCLAVLGFDALQLYTEDTLEIPEYPYAGYMRGRYSLSEIREIREYCDLFGVELIPCIQTLAHLGQALRWDVHQDMWDIDNILLIDEEKTYEFIESLVRNCRKMFTSSRINIGMDEAYQVGMGNYLHKHGFTDRSTLMVRHLKKVMEICRKYDFKPMMWSDMFFYLQFEGSYYDAEGSFSDTVKDAIPKDITLVYWDYYSKDRERYEKMFTMHKDLHPHICFAGGAWRWTGATPNNTFSLEASEIALTEAVKQGVPQVIATLWADDGGESSVFSVLPTLQLYSDIHYYQNKSLLKENFQITTGMPFDDFMLIDSPQTLPGYDFALPWINPPKYMLFQDPLMGLFDLHVKEGENAQYFAQAAKQTKQLLQSLPLDSPWLDLFQATADLCAVLARKCDLGIRLRTLYRKQDLSSLQQIAGEEIPLIIADIRTYYRDFTTLWMQTNKVFGLEIQDIRYGGLIMRLESVQQRLLDYVDRKIANIPELDQDPLPFSKHTDPNAENCYASEGFWRKIVSASAVSGV